MKNEKGFTLIEMLVVLMIITVLIFVAIPNITKHSKSINNKGCEAFIQMVQGQVQAYEMENHEYPANLGVLESNGYLAKTTCPNGNKVVISVDGKVSEQGGTP